MAQIPLNTFKTTTFDILTSEENVYTTPAGVTTVVLMAQVANISEETIHISANHVRDSQKTAIIKDASVPTHDSLSLLTGKLILQTGDTFSIQATNGTTAGQSQLLLSYLETANQ
jgi:hypothetical protein